MNDKKRVQTYQAISIFILTLILGLLALFHPTILSQFQRMQADPGDTRLCNYILEHTYQWLLQNPPHQQFWNIPFMYPAKNVTAYTDVFLGAAPFYWIWRGIGITPETSFQLFAILVSSINFLAVFLLLKRGLKQSSILASLGGFIFSFSASRAALLGHPQLLPHFYLPFAILGVLHGWSWGWFFLLSVAQFYAGFYLGWFNALFFGVFLGVGLALAESRKQILKRIQKEWKPICFWGLVGLLCLMPLGIHYMAVSGATEKRQFAVPTPPGLQSWFYLGGQSWLYFWQEFIRGFQVIADDEQRIGVGLLTLGLSIRGIWERRNHLWVKVMALSFLLIAVITTRYYREVYLWPWVSPLLPGSFAIRSLSRVGLLFLFPISIGICFFFEKRLKKKWVWVLAVICILEQGRNTASFEKEVWNQKVNQIANRIGPTCKSFLFVPRRGGPDDTGENHLNDLNAVWAAYRVGIPTLNGYSSIVPLGWGYQGMSAEEARNWRDRWLSSHGLDPRESCYLE